jgi:prepilin-type N-terminal cleavage/methylation domain-containing protein
MRLVSIGLRAGSRSVINSKREKQTGFTLIEALVALALVLSFAAALGPFLFQARRIMASADNRLAAQGLLRSLLEDPVQRPSLASPLREGEIGGLRWQLVAEPMRVDPRNQTERPKWMAFRVFAQVSWGPGQGVTAETIRLGRPE